MNVYLVIDIGTGNVRVALVDEQGTVVSIERDSVHYFKDELYQDALYFEPEMLWSQILVLARKVIGDNKEYNVKAVTSGSQREGIVLVNKEGESIIGFPNHDHRGREWEQEIKDKDAIYTQTGRYPSSLFSAMKILAIKKRQPDIYDKIGYVMSISDWAGFKLTGIAGYEHSQASETQLYDIEARGWSEKLCAAFSIDRDMLPPLLRSGTIAGELLPQYREAWRLGATPFVTGGADTQLAVESTQPQPGDIVIVSGTTTPVVKIVGQYVTDKHKRTWTNRHTRADYFILETNAGVTGLNLQRMKEVFYPTEGYDVMEAEIEANAGTKCIASLGSLIAGEKAISRGGFVFDTPVAQQLTRADFVKAIINDIANCIKINLDILIDISPYHQNYVWACGGGLQSNYLLQELATLTGKTIRLRKDFQHASVVGGAFACNAALGINNPGAGKYDSFSPGQASGLPSISKWKEVRNHFLLP